MTGRHLLLILPLILLLQASGFEGRRAVPAPCKSFALGMESGQIKDDQITASSSHDPLSVGPQLARLNRDPEGTGGAWCPRGLVGSDGNTFLEVDLNEVRSVVGVLTQGRYGQGQGREFAEAYLVEYWRPGMDGFRRVKDRFGRAVMEANTNTFAVVENEFDAPVLAQRIRILPHNEHPRSVCMRVEILGQCGEGPVSPVTSYDLVPAPYPTGNGEIALSDDTFDGERTPEGWKNGLGQLTDGIRGKPVEKNAPTMIGAFEWVGWKNTAKPTPVELTFRFDQARDFSAVELNVPVPSETLGNAFVTEIDVECQTANAGEGERFNLENMEVFPSKIVLSLDHCVGDTLLLRVVFQGKWLVIGEVAFRSEPHIAEADEEENVAADQEKHITMDLSPISESGKEVEQDDDKEEDWAAEYLGVALGILVTLIFLLLAFALVIYHRRRFNEHAYSNVDGVRTLFNHNKVMGSHFTTPTSTQGHLVDLLGDITPPTQKRSTEEAIYSEPFGSNFTQVLDSEEGLVPYKSSLFSSSPSSVTSLEDPTSTILTSVYSVYCNEDEKRRPSPSVHNFGELSKEQRIRLLEEQEQRRKLVTLYDSAPDPRFSLVPCYASTDILRAANSSPESGKLVRH